jgi:nucleoside-diphosphate-sugar epimerase
MRIFTTGITGYIGSAVAEAFRHAGHSVSGLVRSGEKILELQRRELIPVLGNLNKHDSYLHAIQEAEVIVHCAADYSSEAAANESEFLHSVLNLSPSVSRTIIYTSGVWSIGDTGDTIADESSPSQPIQLVKWRSARVELLLKATSPHLRTVIISPGCVYGESGSLTALWFASAQQGRVEIVGEGHNRWAMVHLRDLARAYVMAAEQELTGTLLNIVDDSHYTVREMATAVAKAAGVAEKLHVLSSTEAEKKYGEPVEGLLIDQQVSNERAARLLGWRPHHHDFIQDINLYYQAWLHRQGVIKSFRLPETGNLRENR